MPPLPPTRGRAVPSGRLTRFARFGGMATGVAGSMIADGARQLAQGQRPRFADLLLTPDNARKVAGQLATLRGAAMKMGQLLSMDGGDLLSPELAEIMGRLRADADPMPVRQLETVLTAEWGRGWRTRFARFDVRPIAAASIGQVHRAQTRDGRDLAIKIQYPGVRRSIDSDVDNVAGLIRLTGQLPKSVDLAPLLAEAKRQLHEEADYVREAEYLARFGTLLADARDYRVPGLHADFTTKNVLAMDFVAGVAVEKLADDPQPTRDRVMGLAIALVLRELFDFGLMQTDPNFANFRYDRASERLVLLDFGASREFSAAVAKPYRELLHAGLAGDSAAAKSALLATGFIGDCMPASHHDAIAAMFTAALAPLRTDGHFDFADRRIIDRMREQGLALAGDREVWRNSVHVPPIDALFLQRKFAGLYLLGRRLAARVDMAPLLESYR